MANYLLVRHRVRDFAVWKSGYDAHQPKRREAGLSEVHLLRGALDASEVVLLFRSEDLGRAKAFTESADLRETMERLGVLDRPDIFFLKD